MRTAVCVYVCVYVYVTVGVCVCVSGEDEGKVSRWTYPTVSVKIVCGVFYHKHAKQLEVTCKTRRLQGAN